MKKIFLIYFILLCSNSILGQIQIINFEDSAIFYFEKFDYEKALHFALDDAEYKKNKFGENDTLYLDALTIVASDYYTLGKYVEFEKYQYMVLDLINKNLGRFNKRHIESLIYLANVKAENGSYDDAFKYYKEAISDNTRMAGGIDSTSSLILINLGTLYYSLGNYNEAEKYLLQGLDYLEAKPNKNDELYFIVLSNVGIFFEKLGNFVKAEKYLSKALEVRKNLTNLYSPTYPTALNNLGYLFYLKGEYLNAQKYFIEALEIRKKILGLKHIDYVHSLNKLSENSIKLNKYEEAEKYQIEAIACYEKLDEKNSLEYVTIINNLGMINQLKHNYTLADSFYSEAKKIRKDLFGEEHPDYINSLFRLTNLYNASAQFTKSELTTSLVLEAESKLLLDNLNFLSEEELIKFLNTKSNETNLGFSLLSKVQTNNLLSLSYNFRLLFSGVSIQNTTNLNKSISKLKDSVLFDLFKNFKSNKSLISKTVSQPIAQRDFNIDSLIIVADRQEKKLIRSSADYRNSKDRLNLTWDKIRNNLKPNETSIEFVKFNYFDKSEEGINQYAAIILRPIDTVPIFVNLCNENQLKEALKQFAYKTSSNTRGNSNKSNAPSSSSSTDLYKLFWQPLEKYLTNTKTIYFAPDGLLHQIAFAAIPYAKDKLLSDKYNLVQVTSTRQVAIKGNSNQALTSIALFGGINYNKQTTDSFNSVVPDPYNYVYQQNRGVDIDSFKYLPNTFKEVNDIKANMDLQSKKVFLYNGANATEASFRKFSTENTSPSIIHFATHGFTLPNASQQKTIGETNVFKVSDNPLLRCGLVMAGGNKGWKGMSSIDEDDGILTGLEISNSSLQNTQLAVLSACETGTGELNGSEGVFGLQRAFKLAGVNYVMAALWQVPDKETAAFMNAFYKNLIGGKTIRQSFLSTQKFMRKKYSPYYWAAFTLVQ